MDKFEVRCDLESIHRYFRDVRFDSPARYVTSLEWTKNDDGLIKAVFGFEDGAPDSRQGTLERIAFSQKVCVYVATIQERGMMGQQRTILVKDLHIFEEQLVIAHHMWFKLDWKWSAIEPLYQGTKVVLVGPVIEYERADGTKDYTLELSKVTRLWTA